MMFYKKDRRKFLETVLTSRAFPDRCSSILSRTRDPEQIISLLQSETDSSLQQRSHRVLNDLDSGRYHVLILGEPAYPESLARISDPPLLLFLRGTFPERDLTLAVVGGRKASPYGLQAAAAISADLGRSGIHIVSGLARGIDGAAHRAVLEVEGVTTAVLGSGLDRLYPLEHGKLAEAILDTGGAILSEYPPGTPPLPHHFPRRNRIIAGLSRGVIVIEAGLRSGSLITARLAVEENRDVFVVPGSIFQPSFAGSHRLLREGAILVTGSADILEEYDFTPSQKTEDREIHLGEEEWTVYSLLDPAVPRHPDELKEACSLTTPQIGQVLLEMELKGVVIQVPGGLFLKKVI
ncbi:MAG TPA: DNA-processing protein DprA [Thermoanaerobaculia bacterium]|nr:DNA-processing protein DprA [Thermoanaerobaculia bacterium]HUM30691.1 DNA-processing protein DprA [Thermoanaerobaculia bacterium]HXK68901.1 DNA-processing protein DprA [Thermoanaerobaculia bacterium]